MRFFLPLILLLAGIRSKAERIIYLDNHHIRLEIVIKDQASLAESDWLSFVITNKSDQELKIKKLDYSINGFDSDANGNPIFIKSKFGQGDKYKLLHWFHDFRDLAKATGKFSIAAGESSSNWKFPSNETGLLIEESLVRSEEFCALLQIDLEYSFGATKKQFSDEQAICTYWTKYTSLEKDALVRRFETCIIDIHEQRVHSSLIALLLQLEDLIPLIDNQIICLGIINRNNKTYDRERIWLLSVLKKKATLNNPLLLEHYRSCIQNRNCRWEDDFAIYWHNELLEPLLKSQLYVTEKATILEIHSASWSREKVYRDMVFEVLSKELDINLDEKISAINFKNWYNRIKFLASSRHDTLLPYFKALLENKNFYPVQDWSSIGYQPQLSPNQQGRAKTIYFRVCDIAYVCLLRLLDQAEVTMDFFKNKLKPNLFIDNKWRGKNPENKSAIRLETPYTVLQPNLKLAEKYYYLYDGNRAELNRLIKAYEEK